MYQVVVEIPDQCTVSVGFAKLNLRLLKTSTAHRMQKKGLEMFIIISNVFSTYNQHNLDPDKRYKMVRWINQFKISLKLTRMPHYDMRSFLTTVAISRDCLLQMRWC